jgi:hypothetical protein
VGWGGGGQCNPRWEGGSRSPVKGTFKDCALVLSLSPSAPPLLSLSLSLSLSRLGFELRASHLQSRCPPPSHSSVHFALVILEMGSPELFAQPASNLDPPDPTLSGRWDYGREPPCPAQLPRFAPCAGIRELGWSLCPWLHALWSLPFPHPVLQNPGVPHLPPPQHPQKPLRGTPSPKTQMWYNSAIWWQLPRTADPGPQLFSFRLVPLESSDIVTG